jgi:uncharacterized protein YgiB involved in biofilm formation
MKKSKTVRLVLLGGTSLALAGCDDSGPPTDAKFFSSLNECTAHYSEDKCRTMVKKAEEQHVAEAPKFTKKEECEGQFGVGNCESRQAPTEAGGIGSFFMPMMMGYMMGNMLGGRGWGSPVYRDRSNTAFTNAPGGRSYNVGSFDASAGRNASFQQGAMTQVARNGFGTSARSYSSSGTSGSAGS